MDRGDDAANHYNKARDIFEHLAALDRANKNWQGILSEMEVHAGRALLVSGRLGDANAAFQGALATQKQLTTLDPGNALWQELLADAHDGLGDGLITKGEPHG